MTDPSDLFGTLTGMGYSPAAAAGILGNLKQESSFNPTIVGDNGTSYGLAQWHGPRWDDLKNFAAANNTDAADPNTQLQFLHHELQMNYPSVYAGLQAAKTPEEAATAFLGFERPKGYTPDNPMGAHAANTRLANATALYNQYGGGAGQPMQLAGATPAAAQTAPVASAAPANGTQDDAAKALYEKMYGSEAQMRGLLSKLGGSQQAARASGGGLASQMDMAAPGGGRGLAFNQIKVQLNKHRFS